MNERSRWWRRLLGGPQAPEIPEALWQDLLRRFDFLGQRPPGELARLRELSRQFLACKEFSGAQGLVVTDAMALAIAAQACLPVLHLGLHWYDDFRGIVVHPRAMRVQREVQDDIGLVHHYDEELSGEAMEGGPVTLSWEDVGEASAEAGYNVVIHEFAHKLDMRDGAANGCPPLSTRALRERWAPTLQAAYDDLVEALEKAERFGGPRPWLDAYAATAPAEFFAVACEAYFVNRSRLAESHPALVEVFDAFFRPGA